jgi:ferrochelatase
MNLLILNQLGTPNSPEAQDVGHYLNEFLMDENIISIPRPIRDIVVKILIVPRRKFSSAEKYKKVWTNEGSPLAINTYALENKIKKLIPNNWNVLTGMRYGSPSLESVLSTMDLSKYEKIYFLPLYPQFAQATTGSAVQLFFNLIKKIKTVDAGVKILAPFFSEEWFIQAQSERIRPYLSTNSKLLFSYHGIPVSQEKKGKFSYLSHCRETSNAIAKYLKLKDEAVMTSFQSRVGPLKWLQPSTEEAVNLLISDGVKELVVACPSFVADCLETIEEIGMELEHQFISSGGMKFTLVPCLNDDIHFAQGIVKYATEKPVFLDMD